MPKKVYTYPDDSLTKPLTDKEAMQAGFCPGCGWFIAGHEADDQSIREFGLCYVAQLPSKPRWLTRSSTRHLVLKSVKLATLSALRCILIEKLTMTDNVEEGNDMLDAQELKLFRRITKVVEQLKLQYADTAIIISTYHTRYYENNPKHPVQVINVYIYVGNHMTELELPPTGELENRLPGMIEAVVNVLKSIESVQP